MPKYVARLAPDGTVLHVSVVRDTVADPLALAAQVYGVPADTCRMCGEGAPLASVGWGWEAGQFARPWVPVAGADTGPEDAESGFAVDALVWADGHIWRSRAINNVTEPSMDVPTGWSREDGRYVVPAGWQYQPGEDVTEDGESWFRATQETSFRPSESPAQFVAITGPGGDVVAPTVGEWAAGVPYGAGAEASYQGVVYVIVTPHTSQVGWEPPNVPALWAVKP